MAKKYSQYYAIVDSFFRNKDINWGVLFFEVSKYIQDNFDSDFYKKRKPKVYSAAHKYASENYSKSPTRNKIQSLLLQTRKNKKIKLRHFLKGSQILAKRHSDALARLFFEIEDDIELLTKGNGYSTLKILYKKGPSTMQEIRKNLGYSKGVLKSSHKQSKFEDDVLAPLISNHLIKTEKQNSEPDKYKLSSKTEKAFDQLLKIKNDLKTWEYRLDWISP
ncbi:MAG: hypothetical protein R6U26_02925 [Candidatus Undinarchaeales archaeon]